MKILLSKIYASAAEAEDLRYCCWEIEAAVDGMFYAYVMQPLLLAKNPNEGAISAAYTEKAELKSSAINFFTEHFKPADVPEDEDHSGWWGTCSEPRNTELRREKLRAASALAKEKGL